VADAAAIDLRLEQVGERPVALFGVEGGPGDQDHGLLGIDELHLRWGLVP
jgi:hypothetical protein